MNINKLWLVIGCGLFIVIFYLIFSLRFFYSGGQISTRNLEIKTGMGFSEIADKVKSENLVPSKIIFEIYSLISGSAGQFKPGRYILSTDISVPELVRILSAGPSEISVVIAPGMTVKEIDEKLSGQYVIQPNELTNFDLNSLKKDYPWLQKAISLEGFLFPDTYSFFRGSDIEIVIKRFLDNFKERVLPFFANNDKIVDTINLASILEKEIPDYRESQIAASILAKRLAVGMPLQVDAALVYGKCFGKFLDCPPLQEEDFKIKSPYNTYLYGGLPETPICNPGLEAIKAALNPEKSDYWYYLSDPKTQKTIFSKTLDEHNKNRAKYLLIN